MSEAVEQTRPAEEPAQVVVDATAAAQNGDKVTTDSAAVDKAPTGESGDAAVDLETQDDAEEEEAPEDIESRKVTLADLSAKGASLYAHKSFEEAAEIFSKASVLQAEINGETAPENAEILFHYGRSLFRVGQSKSDVLGGPAVAGERKLNGKTSKKEETKTASAEAEGSTKAEQDAKAEVPDDKKPLFQFTGDENFDESDGEEEQGEGDAEEEDDDLANAFEILDLARVCYVKQLDKLNAEKKDGEESEELSPAERHVKERLADTHDALAEISLENERYPNAIDDGRVSLKYKLELYPEESEIIAEAHYKLSLALEFASITMSGEDGANTKREEMDQSLRDEAIKEMELAIKSFKLKMQAKEVEVATMASPEDNELSRKAITEMKEVIADMEQRLIDLKKNPIEASDFLGGPEGNALGGIFGSIMGETPAEIQARVDVASKNAVDLTSLVRKKVKAEVIPPPTTNGKSKRKAEDDLVQDGSESPKKAKVDFA